MPPTKPAPATELPEQTLLRIGSAVRSALYRWMYDLTTQVERDVIDDLRFFRSLRSCGRPATAADWTSRRSRRR